MDRETNRGHHTGTGNERSRRYGQHRGPSLPGWNGRHGGPGAVLHSTPSPQVLAPPPAIPRLLQVQVQHPNLQTITDLRCQEQSSVKPENASGQPAVRNTHCGFARGRHAQRASRGKKARMACIRGALRWLTAPIGDVNSTVTDCMPGLSRQRDGSFSANHAVSRLEAPVTPQKAKKPIE